MDMSSLNELTVLESTRNTVRSGTFEQRASADWPLVVDNLVRQLANSGLIFLLGAAADSARAALRTCPGLATIELCGPTSILYAAAPGRHPRVGERRSNGARRLVA